jgi:hypothetical protein
MRVQHFVGRDRMAAVSHPLILCDFLFPKMKLKFEGKRFNDIF